MAIYSDSELADYIGVSIRHYRGIGIAHIGIWANFFLYTLSRISRHIGTAQQIHDRIADSFQRKLAAYIGISVRKFTYDG